MKGEYQTVSNLINHTDKFLVPIYQRKYEWEKKHCKKLFDDMTTIKNHYIGNIICVKAETTSNIMEIIDGQQRITTIFLILWAMYHLIKNGLVKSEISCDEIHEDFLIKKFLKQKNNYRLSPNKKDSADFEAVIENKIDVNNKYHSKIIENYKFFYKELQKEGKSIDFIYESIQNSGVVAITALKSENPQLIFESINSTGRPLKLYDKVKNFLLIQLKTEDQNELYNKYWEKIEELSTSTKKDELEAFIKDYLFLKNKGTQEDTAYEKLKQYILGLNGTTAEKILKEMARYSGLYRHIISFDTNFPKINILLQNIYLLGQNTIRPLLLVILDLLDEKDINDKIAINILSFLEIYIFRRQICLDKKDENLRPFSLALKRVIIEKNGDIFSNFLTRISQFGIGFAFPDDDSFKEGFKCKSFGKFPQNLKIYALSKILNANNKEYVDVYNHRDIYTVEHIMPQTLSPEWKKDLGENFIDIKKTYINRIGNLTLIGYNSELGNKPFSYKKSKYIKSCFDLNKKLCDFEKFGSNEIEKRTEILYNIAAQIWKYPEKNKEEVKQ